MKILNINKLKNEQNNITLLQEFAQDKSIKFLNQLSQLDKENRILNMKNIIKQYQPLVNKIYAEVLGYELIETLKQIERQTIDIYECKQKLMISTCDVLDEIQKNYNIKYDKEKVDEAFAQVSLFIDNTGDINSNRCGCCDECIIS